MYFDVVASAELEKAHDSILKGSVEDDYELIEEIGQGQYAVVHKAEKKDSDDEQVRGRFPPRSLSRPPLGQLFAVKLIDKKASGMAVTDKEIGVMMRIDNPNCVKLFQVGHNSVTVPHCRPRAPPPVEMTVSCAGVRDRD